jgi:cytochrome c oxidase cbb3-type subunit I
MTDNKSLTKFFVASALFFIWVTVQGALQAQKPIHDFIAEGPAQIIPGAHAHVGLLGWVSIAMYGLLYYMVPLVSGKPLSWPKLVNWVFWLETVTVALMAGLMIWDGVVAGMAFKAGASAANLDAVQTPFMIAVSLVSIICGVVAFVFAVQILHTALKKTG